MVFLCTFFIILFTSTVFYYNHLLQVDCKCSLVNRFTDSTFILSSNENKNILERWLVHAQRLWEKQTEKLFWKLNTNNSFSLYEYQNYQRHTKRKIRVLHLIMRISKTDNMWNFSWHWRSLFSFSLSYFSVFFSGSCQCCRQLRFLFPLFPLPKEINFKWKLLTI